MKYLVLLVIMGIMGCSDQYEDCVTKKQNAWRENNQKADYAKSSTANEKFRKECESFKKK